MAGKRKKPDPDSLPTLNKQEIEALMADIVAHKGEHEPQVLRHAQAPHNKELIVRMTYPLGDISTPEMESQLERTRATLLYLAYDSLPKSARKEKLPGAEWVEKPNEGILECHITHLAKVSDYLGSLMSTAGTITGTNADAKQARLEQIRTGFEDVKSKLHLDGADIKQVLDRY